MSKYPGDYVELNPHHDFPLAWASDPQELDFLFKSLVDQDLIVYHPTTGSCGAELSPRGWEFLSSLDTEPAFADKAFVAMWFAAEMDDAWEQKQSVNPVVFSTKCHDLRVQSVNKKSGR